MKSHAVIWSGIIALVVTLFVFAVYANPGCFSPKLPPVDPITDH
jgi:hypothetical protein